nr:hypothetical protein [Tanacetum cinerariifolium]
MNDARPNRTFFNKQAHSYANRPVHRTSTVRSPYRAPWVPTINRNYLPVNRKLPTGNSNVSTVCCCCSRHPNTARPKAVINRRNWVNDVKASACWVWKPVKTNSASIILKRYDYVDVRGRSSEEMFPLLSYKVAPAEEFALLTKLLILLPSEITQCNNHLRLLSATITLSNKAEDPILEFSTSGIRAYKQLENLKLEKDEVDGKLAVLLKASKNLDNLIESERSDKNKDGVGYSAVPPPVTDLYLSPKKDLSWTGLPEFADDTVTDYSRPSPTIESSPDDAQNKNPSTETGASDSTILSKPAIKFVKAADKVTKRPTTDKVKTAKKPTVKKMVKKSFTPRPVAHRPDKHSQRPVRTNMNDARPNRKFFNKQAHSYVNRPVQRTLAVRSPYRAPWVPTVNWNYPPVNRKLPTDAASSLGEDRWDLRAFNSRNLIADAASSLGEDCWELNV